MAHEAAAVVGTARHLINIERRIAQHAPEFRRARSGGTRSSASIESTQSPEHASIARFFCTPKPSQSGASMTRAPAARAISHVRSLAAAVDDDDFIGKRHAGKAVRQVAFFVQRDDGDAQAGFHVRRGVGERHLTAACEPGSLQSRFASRSNSARIRPSWLPASSIYSSDNRLHSPVNEQVDAVFVLSVRSFHDRIAHIEAELRRHGIAFEWIFEHDAAELGPELIEATFAPSDMGPPQQSLVLKHIETWKRCVERGYRRVLVFEDDAMLAAEFFHRCSVPQCAAQI